MKDTMNENSPRPLTREGIMALALILAAVILLAFMAWGCTNDMGHRSVVKKCLESSPAEACVNL